MKLLIAAMTPDLLPDFDTGLPINKEVGTDFSLLQRIRLGDQVAMAELFDRHSSAVFSVAVRILKDPGHAEDVMQEIFFKIWQDSDSFMQTRGSLRCWLMAITRNRSIDVLRRRKPTESIETVILASRSNLCSQADHNVMVEKVQTVLKALPEAQRVVMNLAFFEELSHAEISLRTGQPLGTIKTRIRSALITLRKALVAR